ncbi:probable cytochrome P450 49a1 [Penaeus vannamei]|uniref:probable cytochrome P450 49a1 n=1 Tax=Penaeus vannamei TaxID=6689 RepID=UPI000F673C72|nr:probable cytochrome P450 49a1 [Penaeus vannamei]
MVLLVKKRALLASLSRRAVISRCLGSSSIQEQLAVPLEEEIRDAKPISEIPGPKSYPVVGSLLTIMKGHQFDKMAAHKFYLHMRDTHGHIYRMTVPIAGNFTVVSNPDDCEKLLRVTMHNPQRLPLDSIKAVREETVDGFFKENTGLLLENGEKWWRVRSKVQTPMMKPKMVGAYLQQMDEVSREFTDRIAQLQEEHGEMPSDFQFELYKWALESVSLVALNRRMGCLNPDVAQDSETVRLIGIVNGIFQALNDLEMGSMLWRLVRTPTYNTLKRRHGEFLEIAMRNIQETEAAILAEDPENERELSLMETLLLTEGLTRKDVLTLILDMLTAGIDTTSHTLGFALYLLARNPQAQAKLHEELDTVLGDHQGPLLPKHMAQLSYLKAVIRETLRIFPIAIAMVRILDQDAVLGGYVLPKGEKVIYPNMIAAWDEHYFPRAKEFIPDRWLRGRPLGPIHPYASLPFGAGTRMCIGRRIAEQEMYTFLARVMQRFTIDYKYEDVDIRTRLVCMPSQPLRFSFTERR